MSPITTFPCSKCGEAKPESDFYNYKRDHACKPCCITRSATWAKANPGKANRAKRDWKSRTSWYTDRENARRRNARVTNPEKYRSIDNAWKNAHPESVRLTKQSYNQRNKEKVFAHYGRFCACCGEGELVFLAIDHIDDNGAEHRRQENIASGASTYAWLIKNHFPDGFQTLCMNCNWAKSHGGCPHADN